MELLKLGYLIITKLLNKSQIQEFISSFFAAQFYASTAYVVMWCLCVCHVHTFCQNK